MPAPSVVAPPPTMAAEVSKDRTWLRSGRAPEPDRAARGAGGERCRSASERQWPGQHFGRAAHSPIGRRIGARSMAGGLGHRLSSRSATSVGIWRRLAHWPWHEAIAASGLGGALDAGLATAPPSNNGGGSASGVVVSSQPGSKLGLPGSGGSGALAMSPSGGDKPGLGGSGGGGGIGRGDGPGSGFSGPGSGAGKEGAGPGSDPMARGGISPYPGTGGAGTGTNGTPAMPGVSVKGGSSNIVTLPSFGSNSKAAATPGTFKYQPRENTGRTLRSSPVRVPAAHSISTARSKATRFTPSTSRPRWAQR